MRATIHLSCAALACVATLWGMAAAAFADDLMPPPWRGQQFTTQAEWEFLTANNPDPPDGTLPTVVGNGGPFPGPMASMGGAISWDPFDGDGAWIGNGPIGSMGQIALDIPNWIDTNPIKWVQIQMTVQQYTTTDPLDPTKMILVTPYVDTIGNFSPPTASSMLVQVMPTIPVNPTNGTVLRTELWKILPNPEGETIYINVPVDTLVDEIVVDTISTVPEPGTCCLSALALLGIAATRIRRR
jgi:hypothetical protein